MENQNDGKYLPELMAERDSLDASFTHAMKLLSAGKIRCFFFSLSVINLNGPGDSTYMLRERWLLPPSPVWKRACMLVCATQPAG